MMLNGKTMTAALLPFLLAQPLMAATLDGDLAPLDLDRVTHVESLGQGQARFEFVGAGSGSRFVWESGEVLRVDLDDGSSRFLAPEGEAREVELDGMPMLPRETRMIEIPPGGDVWLNIESIELAAVDGAWPAKGRDEESVDCVPDGDRELFLADTHGSLSALAASGFDQPVLLGEPVIFRDLRMVSVALHPLIMDESGLRKVERIEFSLGYGTRPQTVTAVPGFAAQQSSGNEKTIPTRPWSSNMQRIYESMVSNQGQFYNNVDDTLFPVYLITGSPNYLVNGGSYIAEFVKWKREKGFDVRVVPFDEIPGGGVSIGFGNLRNWVSQQWEELRPEYLLLLGDDDGIAACPDSVVLSIQGEFDVSDHFYSLQEGNDYFPEIFVGRFSVDNAQQLATMALKPVIHEKYPTIAGNDGWRKHGLVVSCNYSDSGNHPVTPNLTSRWVIDKLRANGFTITSADSIFYPPTPEGGSAIGSALNQGRGIVSYRGWANSNGWIYPAYDRDDIDELNNVMRMPIVTSYVCQTGAFGAGSSDIEVEDPCFGEKFVRLGDPSAPRGAVAFIGPSDLHTRSQYNNPVCSGFFNAVFDLNLTSIGPALLNGKMELWRGYPLERSDPYGSYFYFHVYNVLGDPDLKFWRDNPLAMTMATEATLRPGQNTLEVWLNDTASNAALDGVTVTLTAGSAGEQLLGRGMAMGGYLALQVDPGMIAAASGAITLTADHLDYVPAQQTLAYSTSADGLALNGLTIDEEATDGLYLPNETLSLHLDLENAGTEALASGSAELVALPGAAVYYTIESSTINLPALNPGETTTSAEAFAVRLAADLPHGLELPFHVRTLIDGESGLATGRLTVSGAELTIGSLAWRSGLDRLVALQPDTLDITVENSGVVDIAAAPFLLSSEDDRVEILEGRYETQGLDAGASTNLSFVLRGGLGLFPGQQIPLELHVVDEEREVRGSVMLPTGELESGNPLGPDAWGYYAIESEDYGVSGRPDYEWVELDPAYGGSGATRLYLTDDDVTQVELPFPLNFYGQSGTEISICSNGWISLGSTWMDNFRNWNIPSSLGPPNMICAYWDDLKPKYTASQDSIFVPVFVRHDDAEGRVVISWSRTYNRYAWENPGQPLQEFQIILYDQETRPTASGDTEILVQFKDVTDLDQNNNFSTCGLQNFGHNIGIQVTYADQPSAGCLPIAGGRSVLFTTQTPRNEDLIQVNLLSPVQNQWLNSRSPRFEWDHAGFVDLVGTTDVQYHVTITNPSSETLLSASVGAVGHLDLMDSGDELPENVALGFRLTATSGGSEYESLQGTVTFLVDATPPVAIPALQRSSLFSGHIELGLLLSEALASLEVEALDASGTPLVTLEQNDGPVALGDGRELRYLQAQLNESFSSLRIFAEDLHGLQVEASLPLQASSRPNGLIEIRDIADLELAWQGNGDWVVAMGSPADGENLLPMGRAGGLDLQLPGTIGNCRLSMDAPLAAVLVRSVEDGWERVVQERVGDRIEARITQGGRYALMDRDATPASLPTTFRLAGNHPNPFNPETVIRFELPAEGRVKLAVFNLQGEQIRELVKSPLEAGLHQVVWSGVNDAGRPVASGVYIARIEWQGRQDVHKMLLVR